MLSIVLIVWLHSTTHGDTTIGSLTSSETSHEFYKDLKHPLSFDRTIYGTRVLERLSQTL